MLESLVSERSHIELPTQEVILVAEPAVPTTEIAAPVVAPVAEISATSIEAEVTTVSTEALEENIKPKPETPDCAGSVMKAKAKSNDHEYGRLLPARSHYRPGYKVLERHLRPTDCLGQA